MNRETFIGIVSPLSMTSINRISGLYESLEHIRINNIDGDLVECGVWRGGNILGMMEYCYFHNMNKKIWLYDTFEGMTEPSDRDINKNNIPAKNILDSVKCFCPIDEVKNNLSKSSFSQNNLRYIIGDVNKTLRVKEQIPESISLLRLDTDWYDSTLIELQVLFPILSSNGILILDDYGHWKGCQQATDEYFKGINVQFKKLDYTGRLLVK